MNIDAKHDVINYYNFSNLGFLYGKFTNEQLSPVRKEIEDIQKDFSKAIPHNKNAIGHLQKQFKLNNTSKYLENIVIPFIETYNYVYPGYIDNIFYLTQSVPFILKEPWVNFQKKYEFNPPHIHSGIYSFVIYIKVPYLVEDERKVFENTKENLTSNFSFLHTDSIGRIVRYDIPVDKTYENMILFFPSSMTHCVYPFFTSDEYRISVAGNIYLDTNRKDPS